MAFCDSTTIDAQGFGRDISQCTTFNDTSTSILDTDLKVDSGLITTLQLSNLRTVNGDVGFTNTSLTDINLQSLRTINGNLEIKDNLSLGNIYDFLPALRTVNGNINISGAFSNVLLPSLRSVDGEVQLESSLALNCATVDFFQSGAAPQENYLCQGNAAATTPLPTTSTPHSSSSSPSPSFSSALSSSSTRTVSSQSSTPQISSSSLSSSFLPTSTTRVGPQGSTPHSPQSAPSSSFSSANASKYTLQTTPTLSTLFPTSPLHTTASKKDVNIKAIIGGVSGVAGIALIALCITLLFLWRRRRSGASKGPRDRKWSLYYGKAEMEQPAGPISTAVGVAEHTLGEAGGERVDIVHELPTRATELDALDKPVELVAGVR